VVHEVTLFWVFHASEAREFTIRARRTRLKMLAPDNPPPPRLLARPRWQRPKFWRKSVKWMLRHRN
jgi:hypothetical protein